MDISRSTEPKSDQQNFDDYQAGDRIVTVSEVKAGSAEQPVELHLIEYPGRPYKPSKSIRRVLVACWGPDAAVYAGRKMRLYGDPTVRFGKDIVGGIRIGALSHLEKPVTVSLTVTRGKRAPFTVQPLPNAVDADLEALRAAINTAPTLENLQLVWKAVTAAKYTAQLVAAKDARKAELLEADDE